MTISAKLFSFLIIGLFLLYVHDRKWPSHLPAVSSTDHLFSYFRRRSPSVNFEFYKAVSEKIFKKVFLTAICQVPLWPCILTDQINLSYFFTLLPSDHFCQIKVLNRVRFDVLFRLFSKFISRRQRIKHSLSGNEFNDSL